MTVWVYQGTGGTATKKSLVDPIAYLGGTRAPINEIYAYGTGTRTLVWARNPATVTATALSYNSIRIDWSPPGAGADSYVLKRAGTQIYAGTALTFTDTGLSGGTTYNYTVDVIRAGAVVATSPASATTSARPAMALSKGTTYWDTITVNWTDTAADAATYTLQRGGTVLSSTITGATRTFTDSGALLPSSSYTYTLTAKNAGGATIGTATLAASSAARVAPSLTASALNWNTMAVRWPDANKRSITRYDLYRGYWTLLDSGSDQAHDDGGLAASSSYHYLVRSWRGSEQILPDYETDGTTSARTTSSGSWYGPAATTSGGWTSSSTQNLNGPTANFVASCYISSWNILIWGYSGSTGHFNPHINGGYFGDRTVGPTRAFAGIAGGDSFRNAGNNSTGAQIAGNASYRTEWDAYSGVPWNYNVAVGQINYWWYTSFERDQEMRTRPWWREELADRAIHIDTWGEADGTLTKVKVRDKETDELLVEWALGD